jgi:hypothetical protein
MPCRIPMTMACRYESVFAATTSIRGTYEPALKVN